MATFFSLLAFPGLAIMAIGINAFVMRSIWWKRYEKTDCTCEDHMPSYYKYVYYNNIVPFAFIGLGIVLVSLFAAAKFHTLDIKAATDAKKSFLAQYDTLVLAEEKEAWLATEVGAASSNQIAKLCEMMPKMSAEKKAKLTDAIIELKMKSSDKSVLAFSFASDTVKDILCNAMSYEVNGNVVVFHCIFSEEREVEEEVDVPGELVHGGIRYAQVNGKHVLFHKEKRKVKKTVDTVKKVECKIL